MQAFSKAEVDRHLKAILRLGDIKIIKNIAKIVSERQQPKERGAFEGEDKKEDE